MQRFLSAPSILSRNRVLTRSQGHSIPSTSLRCHYAPCRHFTSFTSTSISDRSWITPRLGRRLHARRFSNTAESNILRLRSLTEEQIEELARDEDMKKALDIIQKKVHAATADVAEDTVYEPTRRQYILYYRDAFIPFVFFGMLDNSIMLLFGDFFDFHLGMTFGISTLTAAALGNVVGDCTGIWLTGTVEALVNKIQLEHHGLSFEQRKLTKSQTIKTIGMTSGIFVGCILGMFPLAWPENYRLWSARSCESK